VAKSKPKEYYQLFLNIDYDDGDQSSYKAIELHVSTMTADSKKGKEKVIKFKSGDPAVDFINAIKKMAEYPSTRVISRGFSSSVDHFVMDGDNYKWAEFAKGLNQIVPKHINSLEEMQEYYKQNKPSK